MTQVIDRPTAALPRPQRSLTSPVRRRPEPAELPTDTRRGWVVTGILALLAAITRFAMLNYPTNAGTPVFDEKHYVPQAWQILVNGGVEDNPGFGLVVHPPVGKQLIAIGEAIFGYNAWGWRFSAAVAGTILVVLVVRITRRLARSTLAGAIAGILIICDGLTFVTSRMGMLDIFLAVLVTGAFGCLICDRDDVRRRLAHADAQGRIRDTIFGPRLGVRWWRFGAGVLLGLACGTKWSGIYFVMFFGLMSVAFDLAARRAYRVRRPWIGTAIRDIIPSLYALVLIPIGVYLASYSGWFASETSVYRHEEGVHIGDGGRFSFIPDALRSLWYYSSQVLKFHGELTNTAGNHHPWESKPWMWPMGLRPMLYYFGEGNTGSCGGGACVKAIVLMGTPALWWVALPMIAWAMWRTFVDREWRYAAVLTGYAAALLPWFATIDRQMYYFYAATLAPFLVMGVALVLRDIIGRPGQVREPLPDEDIPLLPSMSERYGTGLLVASLFVALVVANFIWIWPILTGMPISNHTWQDQHWLPTWG